MSEGPGKGTGMPAMDAKPGLGTRELRTKLEAMLLLTPEGQPRNPLGPAFTGTGRDSCYKSH